VTRPKVVQFVHPGFEYHKKEHVGPAEQRSGVMPWKDGGSVHDRKFMWHTGSALDPTSGERSGMRTSGFPWGMVPSKGC
jgi:hypothetical protein